MARLTLVPITEAVDAEARLQALDITRSWIVEAPAGSGKTALLIQRYLCLLADPKVTDPDQVLAITFTKAATEEIRERVLRELQRAQEGLESTTDYDRATRAMAHAVLSRDHLLDWRLLDDPRRLRVRTIDSVCAEIARSLPILSGGNGSLTPVEEASSLYLEASRRTWLHLGSENFALSKALRHLLLHRDADLNACVSLVAEMLAQRDQWGSLIPLRDGDLTDDALDNYVRKQLDETLDQIICVDLSRLVRAFPEQTLRRVVSLANALSERAGYDNLPSPIAICRELHNAPAAATVHLEHWRAVIYLLLTPSKKAWRTGFNRNHLQFELTASDRVALKQLLLEVQETPNLLEALLDVRNLPPATFPSEQWPVTKALFHVLRQALAELQVVFSEAARCDFIEPALLARQVLSQDRGPDGLERALGTDLKHLLVDEMQDTSTQQYDLVERLTEGWADEQKTVFLVGDPKQSIYLFRQARVERFIETMRTGRLGGLPIGLLQLTANFRTQAGLVTAFNQDFAAIFPESPSRADDVRYSRVSATRRLTPFLAGEDGAAWHLSVVQKDPSELRHEVHSQNRRSARTMRQIVERWQARPLPEGRTTPWKIAVLVQTRSALADVLPELRRPSPIAVGALKIDSLKERPEILDLLSLTRALLHLADRTAWLAVLRAPWCGLSLVDLHILTGRDSDESLDRTMMELIAKHGAEISQDGNVRLERVWPILDAAVRSSVHSRLPERVERTWRSLGGDTFLSGAARSNANVFLDLLRTIDRENGEVRSSEVTRRLQHLYAAPDTQEAAVELTTIHSAKGLEWDVVLVPELERNSRTSPLRLFEWEELSNGRVMLAPIAGKGKEAAALNRWLRKVRSQREAAERKRLFYVACTRAREELHLFGVAKMRKDGASVATAGSLLDAAWPAAKMRPVETGSAIAPIEAPEEILFDIAASSHEEVGTDPYATVLERLPSEAKLPFAPIDRSSFAEASRSGDATPLSHGSTGSFSARRLGTAVHALLELAAVRLGGGNTAAELLVELPAWEPRIRALLRSDGLPPRRVEQHVYTVVRAVRTTLLDPIGQWIFGAQNEAKNEFALINQEEPLRQHRIDRIFRAGAAPGEQGSEYLWIIDYKTTGYVGNAEDQAAVQAFLASERVRHAPQLERYARLIGEDKIHLGLWFPLIGQLTWWPVLPTDELGL